MNRIKSLLLVFSLVSSVCSPLLRSPLCRASHDLPESALSLASSDEKSFREEQLGHYKRLNPTLAQLPSDALDVVMTFLSPAEGTQLRISQDMNLQIQQLRKEHAGDAIYNAHRKWDDLPETLDALQAELHDRNFWLGVGVYLKSVGKWDRMDLEPFPLPTHQDRQKIAFYKSRVVPRTVAALILDHFYLKLVNPSAIIDPQLVFNLTQQADGGASSAQDFYAMSLLHELFGNQDVECAQEFASLAATSNPPFHPASKNTEAQLRFFELKALFDQNDLFTEALTPTYLELFKNPYSSGPLLDQILRKIRAAVTLPEENLPYKVLIDFEKITLEWAIHDPARIYAWSALRALRDDLIASNQTEYLKEALPIAEKIAAGPAVFQDRVQLLHLYHRLSDIKWRDLAIELSRDPQAKFGMKLYASAAFSLKGDFAQAGLLMKSVLVDPAFIASSLTVKKGFIALLGQSKVPEWADVAIWVGQDRASTLADKVWMAQAYATKKDGAHTLSVINTLLKDPALTLQDKVVLQRCLRSVGENKKALALIIDMANNASAPDQVKYLAIDAAIQLDQFDRALRLLKAYGLARATHLIRLKGDATWIKRIQSRLSRYHEAKDEVRIAQVHAFLRELHLSCQ